MTGWLVFADRTTTGRLQGFCRLYDNGLLTRFCKPYDDGLVPRFLQTIWRQVGYKVFADHMTTGWLQALLQTFWWIGHRVSARGRTRRGGGQGNKPVSQPAADAPTGHHQRGRCQRQGPCLVHAIICQRCAERTTGRSTHTFLKRRSWWREVARECVYIICVYLCVCGRHNRSVIIKNYG